MARKKVVKDSKDRASTAESQATKRQIAGLAEKARATAKEEKDMDKEAKEP